MYEDIKSIISKAIGFIFWLLVICFCTGYTLGNYYGMKASYDTPRTFQFSIFPGYFIMLVEDPKMKKFEKRNQGN